ncbi:MAG TPA: hypothetical protein VJM53_01750, partial [Burkholderiales bacterium]|nr:hypothetical protein [Burkholderiales bacterium]
ASYDEEIREAEARLVMERQILDANVSLCIHRARETAVSTITSPQFLLAALGFGFITARFLLRPKQGSKQETGVAKKSLIGALVATAFSIVQAQFGGPLGMARWAATKWIEYRQRQNNSGAAYAESARRYPY